MGWVRLKAEDISSGKSWGSEDEDWRHEMEWRKCKGVKKNEVWIKGGGENERGGRRLVKKYRAKDKK